MEVPHLNFSYLTLLLYPAVAVWVWLPIAGFIAYAVKAWKWERVLHNITFNRRDRRIIVTPILIVLEMILIGRMKTGAVHSDDLVKGFGYLLLSLFLVSIYLIRHYHQCWLSMLRYCLAVFWFALALGVAFGLELMGANS